MSEHIETREEEHVVYEFFLLGLLLKGSISLVEVISGTALFFIPPAFIVSLAVWFLNFIPVSSLQNLLLAEVAKYTEGTVVFVAVYLLSRGLVKIFLIWALLKNKLWAYPASLAILGLFLAYQFYQIIRYHSIIVIAITILDIVVMYFIWREWNIAKRHAANHTPLPT